MCALPVILAIAGDPGGAAALAPVLEHLGRSGKVEVRALAYREAAARWPRGAFPWRAIEQALDDDVLKELAKDAALLLTGTSAPNGDDYEKRLIAQFNGARLPSVVVLDYGANYARRFSDESGRLAYLPYRVTAIDEESRQGLIGAGVPADRIVITGQPALDGLYADTQAPTTDRALREALGVAADETLVVFASHPVAVTGAASAVRQAAIECLSDVLQTLADTRGRKFALVVRPHPKEVNDAHPQVHSLSRVRVYWSAAGEARRVARAADVVAGVETMFLIEAYHMGRPTIAIRLERDGGALPVPTAHDEASLHELVCCALDGGAAVSGATTAAPLPSSTGAVERVAQVIYDLLTGNARAAQTR